MIAENSERKRSMLWRLVISISTVLIILITAFFLIRIFVSNPLEGVWKQEDSDLQLTIEKNGKAAIRWPQAFGGETVSFPMKYEVDKEEKVFSLQLDEKGIRKAAEEMENMTEEEVRSGLSTLTAVYEYSLEDGQMTLTDLEYGDQMVFDKK